ncbi:hypothetical protein NDU88_004025 [Pleurodeles waltl]|uniref:Uncharacterized protein n=1 Tax=Pleurodeles waltl TaxID=8319 RepID=A0AAV7NN79_PLEWA|nr:hypothetical protein NDU88_004025 [Pleurodeles waltl]
MQRVRHTRGDTGLTFIGRPQWKKDGLEGRERLRTYTSGMHRLHAYIVGRNRANLAAESTERQRCFIHRLRSSAEETLFFSVKRSYYSKLFLPGGPDQKDPRENLRI